MVLAMFKRECPKILQQNNYVQNFKKKSKAKNVQEISNSN
jgi:hypothetical protein